MCVYCGRNRLNANEYIVVYRLCYNTEHNVLTKTDTRNVAKKIEMSYNLRQI